MTSIRATLALLTTALLAITPAWAQDDGTTFDFSFDLNSVLVATFEADQAFLEPEAERVRGLVEQALSDAYVVVKMAEVPPFTDYSADVYLRSCPDGQYIGCVFVVGGRAETDWTVGGRVEAVEGGYQVVLSLIDVEKAKLALEFDVVLDGSNDAEFKEGVVKVMDALVNGEVEDLDMRADPEAERAAQAEAERRQAKAEEFAKGSVYEDFDDLERGDVGLDAYAGADDSRDGRDSGKVTFDDLEEMEDRGGLTPWERVDLTKAQYRLYRNQKIKLRDFKAKLQGRKQEIMFRLQGGAGLTGFGQLHRTDIRYLDGSSPNNISSDVPLNQQTVQFAQTTTAEGLAYGVGAAFGYGFTPWFEMNLFGNMEIGPYTVQIYQEQQGAQPRGNEATASVVTGLAGLEFGFAPLPAYPARPTLHIGASYWFGTPLANATDVIQPWYVAQTLPSSSLLLVNIKPGVEVNIGKVVAFYLRGDIDIPVYGQTVYQATIPKNPGGFANFASKFENPDRITQLSPYAMPNFGGHAGLLFRIRVGGLR